MRGPIYIAAVGLLALSACSNGTQATEAPDVFAHADRQPVAGEPRDLRNSAVRLNGTKAGLTYEQWDDLRDTEGGDEFQGFGCRESCAGHEAGWQWAEDHGLSDQRECGGNSWSFVEGCAAYAAAHPPEGQERSEVGLY